jgi:hypothetical protein
VEEVVVEVHIVIDLAVLGESTQSGCQCLHVFQRHPMLVELLVHPIHVGDYAFGLCLQLSVLSPQDACLLHHLTLDLPVTSSLEDIPLQLLLFGSHSSQQLCLFQHVEVVYLCYFCLKLFLHYHDFVEEVGILGLDDLPHFFSTGLLQAFPAEAFSLAFLPQLAVISLQLPAPLDQLFVLGLELL